MVKKYGKDDETEDQDDESGGSGSDSGEAAGGIGSGTWVPNYYELLGLSADEKQLSALAEQALFEQRISLKSQGQEVTALSKMQKLRQQLNNGAGYSMSNDEGGFGANLEQHPELAEMEGYVDPNSVVLPESELAARASNDPKLQLQLRQRMAAKFGMSQDISLQSMKAEYENKMKMRAAPAPGEQPRYRPVDAPKLRPR